MKHTQHSAFTLAEVLIALVLIGIIAAVILPKVLSSDGQKQRNAIAKEIFTTTGELFMACQDSGSCNTSGTDWTNSPVTSSSGTVNSVSQQFINYLGSHLDITSGSTTTLPFTIATGAQINAISIPADYTGASNTTMSVDLSIPNNATHFLIVFVKGTSRVTRYTTKYDITGLAADKTFMDTDVLKIAP